MTTRASITNGVTLSDPNINIRLYCSKQKNFVALFGVSAKIGGKIPFQYENIPSCTYILRKQSKTPL